MKTTEIITQVNARLTGAGFAALCQEQYEAMFGSEAHAMMQELSDRRISAKVTLVSEAFVDYFWATSETDAREQWMREAVEYRFPVDATLTITLG